jgi:Effector-associated domain 5
MAFNGYLTNQEIGELTQAALSGGLLDVPRAVLLVGIPSAYAAAMARTDNPLNQFRLDLVNLNKVERMAGGEVPAVILLQNAAEQLRQVGRTEAVVFERVLGRIGKVAGPSQVRDTEPVRGGPAPDAGVALNRSDHATSPQNDKGQPKTRWRDRLSGPWSVAVIGGIVATVVGGVIVAVILTALHLGNTASTATPASGKTWTETPYTESKTFANFVNAGNPLGEELSPGQAVQVSCRVRGFVVKDGDPWWYRLASSPWNGHYYATSDDFYNTPNTSGNPINGVTVDTRVPTC